MHTEIYFCESCNNAMIELPHKCINQGSKMVIKLNPELLSNEATHEHNGVKVKVFSKTGAFSLDGEPVHTAEIMEGQDKGKWTTVYEKNLSPVVGRCKSEYDEYRCEEDA